jgi:hypothetical protein
MTLYDDGIEIRGILRVQERGLTYRGGICGDSEIPVGTTLAVRLQPWAHDGRFARHLSAFSQHTTRHRYVSGTTTREVKGLFYSGRVLATFHAGAAVTEINHGTFNGTRSHTYVAGDVALKPPGPCPDAALELVFFRRDDQLMRGFGW